MTERRRLHVGSGGRDRGVSVSVGYVLNLAVASLLLAGLFIAGGSFVEGEREQAVHGELTVVGERVVADLMTVDRLAAGSDHPDDLVVERNAEFPARVSGSSYTVTVDPSAEVVALEHPRSDVTVEVPFRASSDVEATTVSGGNLEIRWNATAGHVEVIES